MSLEPISAPRIASSTGGLPSAVRWSQLLLADRLRPGDTVVDATLGNGHDTLFLARLVGPQGHVFGFDVQEPAVRESTRRLTEAGIPSNAYTLVHSGHETMRQHVPESLHGQLSGIMFNLGYLPGSDKSLITHTATTMLAVQEALTLLAPGGLLTIAVYPGHEGGAEEQRHIAIWGAELSAREYEVQHLRPVNRLASPPECWVIWKRPKT